MKLNTLFLFLILGAQGALVAQPDNDFCLDAIRLADVTKFCSKVNAFTTLGATHDSISGDPDKAGCWSRASADVWFRFVAIATDLFVTVNGNGLKRPEIALYAGSCSSTIAELGCTSGLNNSNSSTLYKGGLTIGTAYLIRINSNTGLAGTFQLCVNNFNPPKDQNGDCVTGAVLCDKSSFHVQSVTGFGFVADEANNTCLDLENSDPFNQQSESNSTWFKWTVKASGTLAFAITPDVIGDDIDFALFELNSLSDCGTKRLIRCVATGCQSDKTVASCLSQGCLGVTGLRDGDGDIGENFNCDPGENGFAKSADLLQGKSYALVVNNYSSAGNGFFMEFGGSSEFLGPIASFDVMPKSGLKCEVPFTISDSSTFGSGAITKYTWNFGDGAVPNEVAFTKGPHKVNYKSFGIKTIVLVVESDRGCTYSFSKEINVLPCCEDLPTLRAVPTPTNLLCNGIPSGSILIRGQGGTPDYQYALGNGKFVRQFNYNNLNKGSYTVKITDARGCRDSTTVTLTEPPPIIVNVGPDLKGKLGYEVRIGATYSPQVRLKSQRWIPPDGVLCDSCFNTEVIPPGSTKYKFQVVSENGCIASDSLFIEVSLDRALYIPNTFTPDREGPNQLFRLYGGRAIESIEYLRVFDRWGAVVYEGVNLDIGGDGNGWDGTHNDRRLPPGVYTYSAAVRFVDRITRIMKGDVTLLR